jgi:hypothetical protein
MKRGVNMGTHLYPLTPAEVSFVVGLGAGWCRWWATIEWPDMCSTPDNTGSRGTLTTTSPAGGNAAAHTAGLRVCGTFLGVPKACNARSTTGNGERHRFAVTAPGRALAAADAATIAGTLTAASDIYEIWNEPNILDFSKDQGYLSGAESTPAVFGLMVADIVDAVRAAYPTLPLMLGSMAARGDANNPADIAGGYCGHTYGLAVIDWLATNRPNSMPDLAGFHPYIFAGGSNDPNSDPYANVGWNGHVQAVLMSDGMAARGCPRRDALVGTGSGYGRISAKLVITEYGEPSEPAAAPDYFDEAWQATHAQHDFEQILWQQAANKYHPVTFRFSSFDRVAHGAGTWSDHYGDHRNDFTPKASASVFTTFANQELDGSDPLAPPVVPLVPLPPAVTSRITGPPSVFAYANPTGGTGGGGIERLYTRDEQYPRRNLCRGVIFCSGAGGFGYTVSPAGDAGVTAGVNEAIAYVLRARPGQADGYTFLGVTPGAGAHGWGADAAMTALGTDRTNFQGVGLTGGAKAGKVALMGISMGHLTAFNFAVRNPSLVAGVLGFIPVSSLVYHYNGGIETGLASGGFPTEINTAYGLTTTPNAPVLNATVQAQRDPLTRAAEVASIPWGLSYNKDDFVVPFGTVEAFIDAKGGPNAFRFLQRNPTGDHTHTTITGPQLLEFLDSLAW